MNCPNNQDWGLLAMEALEEQVAAPLLAHLKECSQCRSAYEQARRTHLDRVRMYDQFDHGHDSLREQLMVALPPQPDRSPADWLVRGRRRLGDFTMSIQHALGAKATLGLASAAACIGLVVLFMIGTGSRNAFAAAIEQFHNSRTIVCRISASVSGQPMTIQQTGTIEISSEFGSRIEMGMSGSTPMLMQYMPQGGPVTIVTPLTRTYSVMDTQEWGSRGTQGTSSPDAFIVALTKLRGQASRELGRMTIDGVESFGYEIDGEILGLGSGENIRSELWVAAQTYLPVRYVTEMPVPGMADGQSGVQRMIFDQFEWDVPLDAEHFVPDIPSDFTRVDAKAPVPDEAALIKGLGNYAELTDKYPPMLDGAAAVTELSAAVARDYAAAKARGKETPSQHKLMQMAVEIGSGVQFYQQLLREGRAPEYYGKTVSPGQANAVLLRWQLDDGHARVIYGDLRAETLPQ